jgi:hypothetical protein
MDSRECVSYKTRLRKVNAAAQGLECGSSFAAHDWFSQEAPLKRAPRNESWQRGLASPDTESCPSDRA